MRTALVAQAPPDLARLSFQHQVGRIRVTVWLDDIHLPALQEMADAHLISGLTQNVSRGRGGREFDIEFTPAGVRWLLDGLQAAQPRLPSLSQFGALNFQGLQQSMQQLGQAAQQAGQSLLEALQKVPQVGVDPAASTPDRTVQVYVTDAADPDKIVLLGTGRSAAVQLIMAEDSDTDSAP